MVSVTCGAGGPCSSPLALAVSRGFNQSIRPCAISSPGHPDREAAQRNGSFVLPTVEQVAVNRLRLYAGTLTWFNVLPANRYIIREPTSGLEPLTSSHYEWSLRRCRGVQRIANPAYLEGFLCSALPCIALYCAPGGVRDGVNFRFVFAFDIGLIDPLSKVHHMKRSRISR